MESVSESFKRDPDKAFILNYAPIFAGLTIPEKDLIFEKSKVVSFNKNDIIYKQHEASDAFYVLISGRIRIFIASGSSKEVIEYLNCGTYFGIISLLTGETHSVNAEAANDSKVLRITGEDFQVIMESIPKLAFDLNKTLSRRLRKHDLKDKKIFESNIISIFSSRASSCRTLYAVNLAKSIKKETEKNVVLVSISDEIEGALSDLSVAGVSIAVTGKYAAIKLDTALASDENIKSSICEVPVSGLNLLNVTHDSANSVYPAGLSALLTYLTGNYHFVIVNLPGIADSVVFHTLNQSDIIHILTGCDRQDLERTKGFISELAGKTNYPQEKIKVIVGGVGEESCLMHSEASKILNHTVYATLPNEINAEYARIIRRIARDAGDVRIGLALSGGAAFGMAHIGIIKVLEKENIPIDMVSGSSMGALIGAFWASGITARQMTREITAGYNTKKKVFKLLMDFCFPRYSFAKGKNIRIFLKKYLGDKTFQDVKVPFKVVACNLTKREDLVYDSGSLVDAVMASIAIPGVFSPVMENGDLITDGGILEPVPIGILVREGIKKIIAINVLPSPEDMVKSYEYIRRKQEDEKRIADSKGIFAKLKYRMQTKINNMIFPNILDIIVNSFQAMEYVIAESDCQKANVVIRPVVPGVDWFEFFKVTELVKKGEEEARKALPAIRNLLNE